MQTESAVLIPPSDEQAWPSFHIQAALAADFLEHLKSRQIEIQLPPEDIGRPNPGDPRIVEIEVAEEHDIGELERILHNFLEKPRPTPHQTSPMTLTTQPFAHVRELDHLGRPDRVNVGKAERTGSLLAGTALAVYGISQRSLGGSLLAILGGLFIYRGLSGRCELYRQFGVDTTLYHNERGVPGNKGIKIERTVSIERAPTQVYHYWRRLENLPKFLPHLASVEEKSDRLSHWTVRGPAGLRVGWNAEIINDRPGEMISWQSIPGSIVENAGSVWFSPHAAGRRTELKVSLQYFPPAGALGNAIARLFGDSPDRQLAVDLNRFKELVESDDDSAH